MSKAVVGDMLIRELWEVFLGKFADHFGVGQQLHMKQYIIRKQNDPEGTAVDSFERENGEDPYIRIETPLEYIIIYVSTDSHTPGDTLAKHRITQSDIDKAGTKS